MKREFVRTFERRYNSLGEPFCSTSRCNTICKKFKNGNYRKYCDLHDSFSLMRERYWSLFKVRILDRDGCCVKCGSKNDLEVDHILPLMTGGKMWDENNLQTLCKVCHRSKTNQDLKNRRKK